MRNDDFNLVRYFQEQTRLRSSDWKRPASSYRLFWYSVRHVAMLLPWRQRSKPPVECSQDAFGKGYAPAKIHNFFHVYERHARKVNDDLSRILRNCLFLATRESVSRLDRQLCFPGFERTRFVARRSTLTGLQKEIGTFYQYPTWLLSMTMERISHYYKTPLFQTRVKL